ncbi:hypothetical protein BJX64DRAFT_297184 [Aspergillus heterothallicus]
MDTHDVSRAPEYLQLLENQKRTLQNAASRKGQKPTKTKSREQIIMEYMFHRMQMSKNPVNSQILQSSFVPPAYPPSVAELSSLKKIRIKDLTLETHHRGTYILLRAVTPTDIMTAIMAVVEDEDGEVLVLPIYNQEKILSSDGRFTEGAVMLVKEPYLKLMAHGDPGIRVDHLSDIRFLSDHDPLVPAPWKRTPESAQSADSWKATGNSHFSKGEYHLAQNCYSKALDSSPSIEQAIAISLNRTLTNLRTHQFTAALRDLEVVCMPDKTPSEKGLFRKAQALYHLQRFQESCDVHQILSKEYPDNAAARTEFDRARARLLEHQIGKYPFKHMQLEAKERRPPVLDRATFIGPVAVKNTETRGRGLFTTEAVRAGDLLFCEKAFAHAFFEETSTSGRLSLLMNLETETMTIGTQADLIGLIAQKLQKIPSLLPTFTNLHHGTYIPIDISEVDGAPVVDTFLIERIVSLNCFGCALSSRDVYISNRKDTDPAHVDLANSGFHSTGIWCLASYINHCCYANAHRAFVGDMMIVRAAQDIPANTELTFWYKSPMENTSNNKSLDMDHWGFTCKCSICQDYCVTEKSVLMQWKRLTSDMTKAFQTLAHGRRPDGVLTRISATACELEGTYRLPASEVPRLSIWEVYLNLATMLTVHNETYKAIEFALKTLESLGYIIKGGCITRTSPRDRPLLLKKWGLMFDRLVSCWMLLCRCYGALGHCASDQTERYARITYRVCVGEDETFDDTISQLLSRTDGLTV